ncbi:MAG: hypothetical protein U0837_05775 [Dehalococcoidia bacterium]|jgi:hypothetical protein
MARGICIYCGIEDEMTVDHIPPKCLFPGHVQDLLRVPSCSECNNGASQDDEYFRLMLTVNESAQGSVTLEAARDAVLRSMGREAAAGLRTQFFDSLMDVELKTPDWFRSENQTQSFMKAGNE